MNTPENTKVPVRVTTSINLRPNLSHAGPSQYGAVAIPGKPAGVARRVARAFADLRFLLGIALGLVFLTPYYALKRLFR